MKNKILFTLLLLTSFMTYSQVGIGTPTPNSSSQLEVVATNRGVLIPRINLTSSTDASTIAGGNVNSLLIFNTATISDIKPGYYYWFDNKWNRIVVSGETASTAGTVIYNSVTQTFSYIDNSGNSQVIDFSTIVKANETITNQIQNTATGAITYTNEAGNSTISQVVSANAGNLIKAGTDGGAMLDVAAIPVNPTTVSNASTGNTATVTVNGITSTGAPIVNLNETSLSGTSLTTTVNGVASTALDLSPILASGTSNTLGLAGNTLTSNVNGVSSTSNAVSGLSNASTGNTATVTVNGITSSGAPIVNLNETSLSGTSLTTTVNGVASTALDLSPILASGTTNTLGLAGNTLTSNVNGVSSTSNAVSGLSNTSTGNTATITVNGITSTGAPIVNLNETSLSGTSLTTTVNGVASTALDLSPILASGTTNTLGLAGNTLTSNVNGVSSTSNAVSGVSNASTGNTATVTVNGITSTGAPIVNLNETSLSGTNLTTTVNGVASLPLDLAPAISASQTVTDLVQAPSTGVITYTNENGIDQTANVTSTNAGNILTVGTDGGSLLTPATLTTATSVSNASTGNTATVTVNGQTSTGAPIVNLNQTSLSGTSLTTTVNGVASLPLDLAPAISASQTVTDLVQAPSTGVITYTNESGTNQTANVTSTNTGNILTVGTDGGSLLTPTALTTATSVSNASTGNTATVTVNGKTSLGAPIVNLNETSLSGTSLTTIVNGVASTALDLAPAISASQTVTDLVQAPSTGVITYTNESGTNQTANVTSTNAGNILIVGTDGGSLLTPTALTTATSVSNASTGNTATVTVNGKTSTGAPIVNSNTLTAANGNLVSTVNGVVTTPEVLVLIAANNGLTATNGNVQLDGSLIKPTIIATDATNTLAISGLQSSVLGTDLIVVADNTGVLKTKTLATLNANNWNLLGNTGTNPLTNFLGTIDDVPLHFRINNTNAGKITNDTFTTALGYNTISPTATGVYNTTIGTNTLNKLTSGSYNTVFGVSSAENLTTGSNNTALGINSLQNNISGNYNVGVGANAFQAVTSGSGNVGLGNSVGFLRTGNQNIAIGFSADDLGTTGSNNLVIGVGNNTSLPTASNEMNIANTLFATSINGAIGTGSVGIAVQAPTATLDVNGNARVRDLPTGLATDGIVTTDADGNLRTITPAALAADTTNLLTATNGNLVSTVNGVATTPSVPVLISANNGLTATNGNVQLGGTLINPTTTIATTGAANTLAVTGLQAASLTGTDNIVVANPSTGVLSTLDRSLLNNWHTTGNAGTTATGVSGNNFIGTTDQTALNFRINNVHAGWLGYASTGGPGTASVYFGINAGLAAAAAPTSVYSNVGIGDGALSANTTNGNVAIGGSALKNSVNGYNNVAIGLYSLFNNFNGIANVGVGPSALAGNTTGYANVALGSSAGSTNITGFSNTFIGMGADASSSALNYATAIGYGAKVSANNSMVLGGTSASGFAVNVGIGIDAPTATLDVSGTTRVRNLPAGAASDNLVTADANGNLHNRTVAAVVGSAGWLINGNTGTDSATNFLGTTDDQPLMFKVKGANSGMISTDTKGKTNTSLGYRTLSNWSTTAVAQQGFENTAFGHNALAVGGTVSDNTAIGYAALSKVAGSTFAGNTAVGALALGNANSATLLGRNTAVGYLSLGDNTSGSYNTGLGSSSLNHNTTGGYNTALGNLTLQNNLTGNYNVAIGDSAGITSTGSSNILIGGGASSISINTSATTSSNEMNIGNTLFGTGVNGVAGGTAGRIGINTNVPGTTLDVNGQVTIRNLPTGTAADNIVVADATTGLLKRISQTTSSTFSAKTALTIAATTTAPTKATVTQNDFIRYRDLGNNQIEVDFLYSASSGAGAADGLGDYLFTLPNGYSFNLTEQPVYTGASNSRSEYPFALRDIKTAFASSSNLYYTISPTCFIVPYSSTQFRIMGNMQTFGAVVGSDTIQLSTNETTIGGRFTFVKQ